jgi:hypothetical protein
MDKLEIKLWVDFLGIQENPIFQDLAVFLNCFLANHSNELLCEGAEWITQWMTYR